MGVLFFNYYNDARSNKYKIKVLLEELTVPYLGKKFPALYGTRTVDIIDSYAVLNDTNSSSSFILSFTKLLHGFFNSTIPLSP